MQSLAELCILPQNLCKKGGLLRENFMQVGKGRALLPMRRKRLILQQPNLARVGTNDLLFGDSTSAEVVSFRHLQPYSAAEAYHGRETCSLKDACILKIVKNSHLLNTRLLYENRDLEKLWLEIWRLILVTSRDSLDVFTIFANVFGNSPSFKAHIRPSDNLPRVNTLAKDLAPSFRKHRIDQVFSNVSLVSLFKEIRCAKFSNLVVLELSNCDQVSKNDLFCLTNLSNLHSLDLSMVSSLDDSILKSWSMVIKMGSKLQNLNIVLLNYCASVTLLGLKDLMSCGGSVFYIESTLSVNHSHWSQWLKNYKLIKLKSGIKWWIASGKLCRDDSVQSEMKQKIKSGAILHEIRVSDSVEFSLDNSQMEKLWSRRKHYDVGGVKSYYRKSEPDVDEKPAKVKRKAGALQVVKKRNLSMNFSEAKRMR